MSNVTLKSPGLSPILAAFSPEPAEPLPNEGDDVVEAYSFNTGDAVAADASASSVPGLPCFNTTSCVAWVSHPYSCIPSSGLMVLMMILYASLGHKIAARYAYGSGRVCFSAACILFETGLGFLQYKAWPALLLS